MADIPVDEVVDLDAVLDGLTDPTASEVYSAVEDFSNAAVAASAAARAINGGGGEPFNGGTITTALTVTPASGGENVVVNMPTGPSTGVKVTGTNSTSESYVLVNDGNANIFEITQRGTQVYASTAASEGLYVEALVAQSAGSTLASFRPESGVNRLKITRGCYFKFKAPAAPADAELDTSECAFWFDATNGAAKLMIKAKTADGTVVTGNVPLA